MLTAFWLSIYGACLSTVLACFTILRFLREQRFLVVSVDVETNEDEECEFVVWMMNSGSAPISIREIWVGTGRKVPFYKLQRFGLSRHSLFRPTEFVSETMSSEMGEGYGLDGNTIKIGPGEARKFLFSKTALDLGLANHLSLIRKFKKDDQSSHAYIHCLEIRHSRSTHPLEIQLKPTRTLWYPAAEDWRPTFPSGARNLEQEKPM